MDLYYVDESTNCNDKADPKKVFIFSALCIPAENWHHCLAAVKSFRQSLHTKCGIFMNKKLHATEFVAGRGEISSRIVGKWERAQAFQESLRCVAGLAAQGATLTNVCLETIGRTDPAGTAFERLLNRIDRTSQERNRQAVVVADVGKEAEMVRLARRMRVFNPIPSQFGGTMHRPLRWIVEDPLFKDSKMSYFLQMADHCAFALLKREAGLKSKSVTAYRLHKAFAILGPVLNLKAASRDPEGIVRK